MSQSLEELIDSGLAAERVVAGRYGKLGPDPDCHQWHLLAVIDEDWTSGVQVGARYRERDPDPVSSSSMGRRLRNLAEYGFIERRGACRASEYRLTEKGFAALEDTEGGWP